MHSKLCIQPGLSYILGKEESEYRPNQYNRSKNDEFLLCWSDKGGEYISGNEKFQSKHNFVGKFSPYLSIGRSGVEYFPLQDLNRGSDPTIYNEGRSNKAKDMGNNFNDLL